MSENLKKVKPKILSGFMELLPHEQINFNKMIDTIRASYERFGFNPIDTATIELSEVLLAKAGGETEKQVYRFNKGDNDLTLRFDLTVPLARYVAQNLNEIKFPFKRYQIGKVFRGERPQRGRFREFYQCDIDIIGDGSLNILHDAEIPSIISYTFKALGFNNFTVKINNRKVLNGFFQGLDLQEQASEILKNIDKLEKIGLDNVKDQLVKLGLCEVKIGEILKFITISGEVKEVIDQLEAIKSNNDLYKQGVEELKTVTRYIKEFGMSKENFTIDLTIARGLDYYTGTVYETILNDYPQIGSVCSGGRYDNLASHYTDKKLPGVGISIGLSRLYYQLNEIGLFEGNSQTISKVMIAPMSEDLSYAITIAKTLRENQINTELNYSGKNLKVKMKYANKIGVEYIIIIGEEEEQTGILTLKNMKTGEQIKENINKLVEILK